MIVVKDKDRVYVARPCNNMGKFNVDFESCLNPNNCCLWKVKNHKNCIAGMEHDCLLADLLKINPNIIDKNIAIDNLVQKTFPQLTELAKSYKCLKKNSKITDSIIIAQDNMAFVIDDYGSIIEVNDFEVVGYYNEICYGSLCRYKDLPPIERIKLTIKDLSCSMHEAISDFIVIDTKTTKLQKIKI